MTFLKYFWLGLCVLVLSACGTSIQSSAKRDTLDPNAKWVLLPIANHTDTPQAGLSAEALLAHQLRRRGITGALHYPAALSRDSLFEPTERKVSDEAEKWARGQGARFALLGSVQEWRYKVGIDGEPAVGVTLKVLDLSSGQVVWSASGAKSGWSREALSAVAQSLLTDMLDSLPLVQADAVK
jgi:polysaccharide biosynthesis protein PelC